MYLVYIIPCLILIAGALIHLWRGYYGSGLYAIHAEGVDDAYITYRYGWNLLHHGKLSWNESGYRQVEGFTNPLWVLASVLWSIPGIKEWVYPLSVITSILVSIVLLLILIHSVYMRYDQSPIAILGITLVAAMPAIWLHITSGLESMVFGIGLAVLAYLGIFNKTKFAKPIYIVFLTIILGLLRSDAFIYLGIVLAATLLAGKKTWQPIAIGLLISTLILFGWRYFTFGTILPNTAIAKLNFSLMDRIPMSFIYLQFTLFNSGLILFLLVGVAGLKFERKKEALACILIIISWLGYYIYMGGDWVFERHLIGLYFFSAALSAPLWISAKRSTQILFVLILLGAGVISIIRYGERFNYFTPKYNDPWVMIGQEISKDRSKYGVLVTTAAGKIPFYAGGDVIDNLGLNDSYLATIKRDQFVPGHSAGNDLAAIELAKSHPSGIYSRFSYIDLEYIQGPDDISLWVDNYLPQEKVQHGVSTEEWEKVIENGDFFIWSVITEPKQTNSPNN